LIFLCAFARTGNRSFTQRRKDKRKNAKSFS
jgi:hypothetical protein